MMRGITTSVLMLVLSLANAQRPYNNGCCEEYCYDLDAEKPQAGHFGTKTAYQIVKGADINRQYVVPSCSPAKIWILSRHGTRLPVLDEIKQLRELSDLRDEVVDNYEKRHSKPDLGALCDEDLEIIKNWKWNANITSDYASFLTTQGWTDMKYIALNYQRIFPNVLENIYSPEKFLFRHTKRQRTEASYKAFVEGLFGESANEHIKLPPIPEKDMLLTPYKYCKAWKTKSDSITKDDNSELSQFRKTEIYQRMVRDVSLRLGFKFPLKVSQIESMWDMCRYDQAWVLDRPSAWCAAFTPSQISVLEYSADLKNYYENSYGSDVNSKLSCMAVSDMLKHLESRELPKAIAYFAHSASVQLFLTALGAVNDREALRADNFQQMQRRNFKSSIITPFAANLAVIKYDCPNDNERNKIMFFLNQKPLDFDWCNVGLCNWSDVKRMYGKFMQQNCDSTFCDATGSANSLEKWSLQCVLLVVAAYFAGNLL